MKAWLFSHGFFYCIGKFGKIFILNGYQQTKSQMKMGGVFFMHMADALVAPAVAGTMYVCSAVAAGYSVKQVRLDTDTKKIPVMGIMGAFVFATQMINFTIPGTGSSGHLCGGMLLSALLGPYAGFLTMIGVLLFNVCFLRTAGCWHLAVMYGTWPFMVALSDHCLSGNQ
jgi:ABC-type Co2+ transport system permease subunit